MKAMLKKIRSNPIFTEVCLFFFTFSLYLHNLSRSVYGGDVGDFVTAVVVKGVSHPSGYPLFVILGILFNGLPLHQSPAWKVGLISVCAASFTVVFLYKIVNLLLENKIIAFVSALTFAFFYPFWLYAETAEVFSLLFFFESVLLFFALLYSKNKNVKVLYLLSFVAGLSLSNHEIVLLLFPSLAIIVLSANWRIILKPKLLFFLFFLFCLGLLPYIYLPIAASFNPPVNFGNPITFENFLKVVLRQTYGWGLSAVPNRGLALWTYVAYWAIEMPPIFPFSCLVGLIVLLKKKEFVYFSAFFLAFFLTGPFYVVYGNTPIENDFTFGVLERFYIHSGIFLLLFFSFGIYWEVLLLMKFLKKLSPIFAQKKYYKNFFYTLFLIFPAFLCITNFPKTDLHNEWIGDYFGRDILMSLPSKSSIFLFSDSTVLNTLYIQYAFGVRQDVNIVHNTIRVNRNKKFLSDFTAFKKKYKKIPDDAVYLMFIDLYAKDHPVFFSQAPQIVIKNQGQIIWMPYGLLLKLTNERDRNMTEKEYVSLQAKVWQSFHLDTIINSSPALQQSFTLKEIKTSYVSAAIFAADYLIFHYKDLEAARLYYKKAIEIAPYSEIGYEGMGVSYLKEHACDTARNYFLKMIEVNRWSSRAYMRLYTTYKDCFHNDKKKDDVAFEYKNIFGMPISKNEK